MDIFGTGTDIARYPIVKHVNREGPHKGIPKGAWAIAFQKEKVFHLPFFMIISYTYPGILLTSLRTSWWGKASAKRFPACRIGSLPGPLSCVV